MADTAVVTKAVIPAAGLGTRFLPAAKAIPKEMLPVIDIPTIQLVVEEAVAAGLRDVLMVTRRGKSAIEDHFDTADELEAALTAKGDHAGLATVRAPSDLAKMHYVRQDAPKGLGHAVLCAAEHVGNEPFAVLLGDDFIDSRDHLLSRMIDVQQRYGGSVVALMEVEPDQVSAYGCAATKPTEEDDVVAITDLVEKPAPGEAPSNWIVIGRYVCDPAIFGVLRQTPPGRGGEIQLTDALRTLAPPTATAPTAPGTAAACTACCSAAAVTTPATSSTTCAPRSSSPASGRTWPASSCPGCAATWTPCRRGDDAERR